MSEHIIPECFYRVSIKALVLNETRDKFLVCQEDNGKWGLPGGGLDHGAEVKEELQRELQEEMGLQANWIADHPSYFISLQFDTPPHHWAVNVLYETTLEHFDFTPSNECLAIGWVGKDNVDQFDLFAGERQLVEQFDPARHQR